MTGAARGLGSAMAHRFAQEGARIVIADLAEAEAAELASALPTPSIAIRTDVTRPEDVAALVARSVEAMGAIDVFVNNAGITRDASIRNMTLDDWDAVHAVHLRGAFIAIKEVAGHMRERKTGNIINISSLSGKVGNFGQANYSAAKAGLVGLTKVAAKELASSNVRVNAIQPGLIRSAMTENLPPHIWDAKVAEVPLGRAGEPDEVAKVALFLASDLSSYITGSVIEVGGGRYM